MAVVMIIFCPKPGTEKTGWRCLLRHLAVMTEVAVSGISIQAASTIQLIHIFLGGEPK